MKEIKNTNLKTLANQLIEEISRNTNPLSTFTIIVPNLLTEQWFKTYWLNNSDKVLMNVTFKRMLPFINEVFNDSNKEIYNNTSLSLIICDLLLKCKDELTEIKDYYFKNEKVNEVNLFDLSNKLANLFNKYDHDLFVPDNWENFLINKLKENDKYTFLSDIVNKEVNYNNKVIVFGFNNIDNVFIKALNKLNDVTNYLIEYKEVNNNEVNNNEVNNNIEKAISASSKEREIEYVYDEICHIMEKNDIASFSDILVVCPDLSEYEGVIKKVFSSVTDKIYPNIPYCIANTNRDTSNASQIISLLYRVLYKEEFTRNDFYNIITNPNVQKARNIDPAKINDIINSLDSMNIYRDNIKCDEWLNGVYRILLSKLIGSNSDSSNKIELSSETYLPFGTIGLDDESIINIVSIIEDIRSFRDNINSNNIEIIKNELDKWLSYNIDEEDEQNYYYNECLKVLRMIEDNKLNLPLEIIFNSMINSGTLVSSFPSDLFSSGVTFINFNENIILNSKHMFFIGMSNNNLPRKDVKNNLDLRTNIESKITKDIKTLNYLRCNAEHEYFSFVNINLVSQEEYALTNLLNINKDKIDNKTYTLSETRKYFELYAKTEFNKRKYREQLSKEYKPKKNDYAPFELPDVVKQSELADFISEGLMAKIKRLISSYDDSNEIASVSYEPIVMNKLKESAIKKDLLRKMINNYGVSDNEIENIFIDNKIKHNIPYTKNDINDIIDETKQYFDTLKNDRKIINPFDIIIENEKKNWKLSINNEFIVSYEDDKYYFNDIYPKDYAATKCCKIYIASLAYIIKYGNSSNEYNIILNNLDDYKFTINISKALEILNTLYNNYNDYSNLMITPIEYRINPNYEDFVYRIKDEYQPWYYFTEGKIIDTYDVAGFDRNDFKDKIDAFIEYLKENVLFIKKDFEKKGKEDE